MSRRARTTVALLVAIGLACAVEVAWRIAVPPSVGAWDFCAGAQASVLAAFVAWALARARRGRPHTIPIAVAVAVGAAVARALLVAAVLSAWVRHPGILLGACLGPCAPVDDFAARSWIWFGQVVLEGYGVLFAPLAAAVGAWAGRAMWTRLSADVPES